MNRGNKRQSRSSFQILVIDFLVFILLGLTVGFIDVCVLDRQGFNASITATLSIAMFVFLLAGFIFYLFIEHKFNRLKFKNIFLYLGIAIAIGNLIAVMTLPNQMSLPNGATLTITPLTRIYYVVSGLFLAMIPFLYLYLVPRKVNSRHYLDIILYVVLGFIMLAILASFVIDWDAYVNLFRDSKPVTSFFFGQKYIFGQLLMVGIFISMLLRIRHKNWKWILCVIPCYIVLLFSLSKIHMFVGTLMIIIYVIVQLVIICKRSRDNLIITLLIVGFFLLLSPMLIVGIVKSESGLLAQIRVFFSRLMDSAETTLGSRSLIWESAFKLLSSWRVIFGYGMNSFDLVLHQVYTQVAPAWDQHIYAAHNFVIELLGNGGIILLGTYLFIYIYLVYAAIKARNSYNHWYIDVTIIFMALFAIVGMFENTYICGISTDIVPSVIVVSLILGEYYLLIDKDERSIREEIVSQSKSVRKINFKNKLLNLNKKRLIYEAKYIAYDLNNKIRL